MFLRTRPDWFEVAGPLIRRANSLSNPPVPERIRAGQLVLLAFHWSFHPIGREGVYPLGRQRGWI